MHTVGELREELAELPADMPVVVCDTRSGIVEEASFGEGEFSEGDAEGGVVLPIGTAVFNVYLG